VIVELGSLRFWGIYCPRWNGCSRYSRFLALSILFTNANLNQQKHDLAKDLPYGREFSLCERTGSRIENERKILSNTLKAQKTLRDMHRTLVEAISVEGGGMLSKQVLRG